MSPLPRWKSTISRRILLLRSRRSLTNATALPGTSSSGRTLVHMSPMVRFPRLSSCLARGSKCDVLSDVLTDALLHCRNQALHLFLHRLSRHPHLEVLIPSPLIPDDITRFFFVHPSLYTRHLVLTFPDSVSPNRFIAFSNSLYMFPSLLHHINSFLGSSCCIAASTCCLISFNRYLELQILSITVRFRSSETDGILQIDSAIICHRPSLADDTVH